MNKLRYGVAYYYEYLPTDRLSEDIALMKKANINVVRIAESTWSSYEPVEGHFDFSTVTKVLDAMYQAGIDVIIGTPTYAIPAWLARKYPEIMVDDGAGRKLYGARQIMDITHPAYLFYAERIIRKLLKTSAAHPAVIGFQLDNETKHYGTASENVQVDFRNYLKKKFNDDLERLNQAYGFNYWSNRVGSWEDLPSAVGTINGSFGAEFAKFQRKLVTDFIRWQADIVREYAKEGHFITHNFDFEWRKYSFGIQPDVNHFNTAEILDITGVDVYHPTQDNLTGIEIAFAGDVARTTKARNYFVLETESQGFKQWTPYPGQLTLQALSHLASGAGLLEYWHWHSLHNACETYWKGLLSHDFKPNPIYNEAAEIGKIFADHSDKLTGLDKSNRVAVIVSNESLTGIDWFPFMGHQTDKTTFHQYNDVVRAYYDELYKLNIETDILEIGDQRIENYDLLIIPCLYSATDEQLETINQYVKSGGNVIVTFKSGFANEHLQVRSCVQPGILSKSCGVEYQLFSDAENVRLSSDRISALNNSPISYWLELLVPTDAEVLATYDHRFWGNYAAITKNKYGAGTAYYVGTYLTSAAINGLIEFVLKETGLWTMRQKQQFPIINKVCTNPAGHHIEFYFNYSNRSYNVIYQGASGYDILSKEKVATGEQFLLSPWGYKIIESD